MQGGCEGVQGSVGCAKGVRGGLGLARGSGACNGCATRVQGARKGPREEVWDLPGGREELGVLHLQGHVRCVVSVQVCV